MPRVSFPQRRKDAKRKTQRRTRITLRTLRLCMKIALLVLALSSSLAAQTGPKSLSAITSQAQFERISIVYDANTPYALPHVMFVIERKAANKIYYVNKKRYSFH